MKLQTLIFLFLPISAFASGIQSNTYIDCVSEESYSNGRRTNNIQQDGSISKTHQTIPWSMKEQYGDGMSRVQFDWKPTAEGGPTINLITTDKPHNSIRLRSRSDDSLIVVSSTSNFYSAESWTFTLNFNVQSMIATRVQSNAAGVGAELIVYHCLFTAES